METFGDKNLPKTCSKFYCNFCDYSTCKKSSFDEHNLTQKHLRRQNGDNAPAFLLSSEKPFFCEICNKEYLSRNGLWKHKKNCNEEVNVKIATTSDKDLIMLLLKQNTQLIEQNAELVKNYTHNTNYYNNISNSNNKTFNLNLFLNETCKDAMNIMDFVESIQLQLSDLENVGKLGYVEGITNIITKNLKALDVTKRPIHCTDKKREVLYIKDDNKWEKEDDDKKKIRKAIKRVASKNHRLILKFKEAHPDCLKSSSNFSDQYNKIIIESCGGSGDNDMEKEDKIIRNISKTVIVDK